MVEVKITLNDSNKRLDKFVKKYLSKAPESFIYKLFRKKDIKVNKKQFDVIYEDDNILIVNKPTNLLVHDGDGKLKNDDTLTKQVLNYLINNNSYNPKNENTFIPALAHRIDRNTSGLVVFGKTSSALQELFLAFKNHDGMEKEYETLVCGKVKESGKVTARLIKNEQTKIVNVDEINGVEAITLYSPIKVYNDVTHLRVNILTGRTHQIRVHMKHINHPLVGDQKYGNKNSDVLAYKYNMKGNFLHAKKLCFHNLTGSLSYLNEKEFIAPLFDWEIKLINRLKENS